MWCFSVQQVANKIDLSRSACPDYSTAIVASRDGVELGLVTCVHDKGKSTSSASVPSQPSAVMSDSQRALTDVVCLLCSLLLFPPQWKMFLLSEATILTNIVQTVWVLILGIGPHPHHTGTTYC